MKTTIIFSMFAVLLLSSCTVNKNSVMWVSGYKSDCVAGVAKTTCLKVYKGEDLNNAKWETFYAPIEGFEFEEGVMKKIEVIEEKVENPPADASAIKYTMVKELAQKSDHSVLLNGKWILAKINDHPIDRKMKLPNLGIDLDKMLISGNGGCNNYTGSILGLDTKQISIGPVASTKKACFAPHFEDEYYNVLAQVSSYQVDDENLVFLNKENVEILSFLRQ